MGVRGGGRITVNSNHELTWLGAYVQNSLWRPVFWYTPVCSEDVNVTFS